MIYAIPCNAEQVSNHFSRCQQIAIIDDTHHQHSVISTSAYREGCGMKKLWQQTIRDYKVDAVVVRNIGQNMLSSLFQAKVKVVAAPAKQELATLNFAKLTPVESLEYAKASPNRKQCGGTRQVTHALMPNQSHWQVIRRIKP